MEEKESQAMSNLEKFLQSYGNIVEENNTINMDAETVLRDISANILAPYTDRQDLKELYVKGISLNRGTAAGALARMRKMKEDKVYDLIISIEQLNYKLNKDYEAEVKRGVEAGVYNIINK